MGPSSSSCLLSADMGCLYRRLEDQVRWGGLGCDLINLSSIALRLHASCLCCRPSCSLLSLLQSLILPPFCAAVGCPPPSWGDLPLMPLPPTDTAMATATDTDTDSDTATTQQPWLAPSHPPSLPSSLRPSPSADSSAATHPPHLPTAFPWFTLSPDVIIASDALYHARGVCGDGGPWLCFPQRQTGGARRRAPARPNARPCGQQD